MLPPTSSDALVLSIVLGAGLAAAVIDLNTRRVPNTLTGTVALLGLLLALSGTGRIGAGAAVVGCLLGLLLMLPGHLFGATGGGDVKLLAAFGTLLGPWETVTAFLITAMTGGLLALMVACYRGRLRRTLGATVRIATRTEAPVEGVEADRTFAYAPAIAIGAALAAIGV